MKTCIIDGCNNECESGRRYCREHYLERHRLLAKQRYNENRTRDADYYRMHDGVCLWCGKTFKGYRPTQLFCSRECYSEMRNKIPHSKPNMYQNAGGRGYMWMHRRLAELYLGRRLTYNECVHHIDMDPQNNDLSNLMVMSRSDHGKLHNYLMIQGASLLKSGVLDNENCWKNFIYPLTTAWLEMTGAKVIKLKDLSQSAAEPLLNVEGSETMHVAPKDT